MEELTKCSKVLDDKGDQHYRLVYLGEHNGEPEEVVVRV